MPQADEYLLVEGVNVLDNIYDTDQLSIIRGSSALYKSAITAIAAEFSVTSNNPLGHLEAISTGASSGFFLVAKGNASELAENIKSLLDDGKNEFENFTYLTFQVVSCQAQTPTEARCNLDTQLRIAQLQDFTLMPDSHGQDDDQLGDKVCELEGRRIVSSGRKNKVQADTERRLSASVHARLKFGRDQRQKFYQEALAGHAVLDNLNAKLITRQGGLFAEDFVELCQDIKGQHTNLTNKMAVVYIDGNKFGARQREYIKHLKDNGHSEKSAHQSFDATIQNKRATFLASEIDLHLNALEDGDIIPLETLMWGGDEMLLVMPAWQGFDFLQRFFAADWQLANSDQLKPLTHAAGIVFCQASTPIRIIQGLASELAETVKNADGGRQQDGWDYLVLESVDYPTSNDLKHYFEARYSKDLAQSRAYACLPAITDWSSVRDELLAIKTSNKLTKRQLYHVVNALRTSSAREPVETQQAGNDGWLDVMAVPEDENTNCSLQMMAEQRLYAVSEDKKWLRDTLPMLAKTLFAVDDMDNPKQRAWLWLHLIELWDYLAPELAEIAEEEEAA